MLNPLKMRAFCSLGEDGRMFSEIPKKESWEWSRCVKKKQEKGSPNLPLTEIMVVHQGVPAG